MADQQIIINVKGATPRELKELRAYLEEKLWDFDEFT